MLTSLLPLPRGAPSALRWIAARVGRDAVRILVYHGVCRDADRDAAWVPSHYVTQSQLDAQLGLLRRLGDLIDAHECSAGRLSTGTHVRPRFVVTFDDAPANLHALAAPVLAAHDVSAVIFAVTDRLDDGALLPDDLRRLYRIDSTLPFDPAVRAALRHMTWEEAIDLSHRGHWLGAHTRTHARLSACAPDKRRDEIEGSVSAIRARLRTADVPFAFPYGQPDDFDQTDLQQLRSLDVPAIFTGVSGWNRPPIDPLCLRRNCVGLHHVGARFTAEMLGLRDGRARAARQRLHAAQREYSATPLPGVPS